MAPSTAAVNAVANPSSSSRGLLGTPAAIQLLLALDALADHAADHLQAHAARRVRGEDVQWPRWHGVLSPGGDGQRVARLDILAGIEQHDVAHHAAVLGQFLRTGLGDSG